MPPVSDLRGQLRSGARLASQWRLLLLWLLALALPWLLALLPLWRALAAQLDQSLAARVLVERFELPVLAEALMGLGQNGFGASALFSSVLLLALLLPWLSGSLIAVVRAPLPLGFQALLQGGLREYGRMSRLWLWALCLLGAVAAMGGGLMHWLGEKTALMQLESEADRWSRAVLLFTGLLFLLVHASLDAARARLALEPQRRSVLKAWRLATRDLWRQPRRLLGYLLITALGLLAAVLIGLLRAQLAPVGAGSQLLALALGQLLVLALVWMRCARVFALAAAGRLD
ncbi:hypothetical protein [Paucibacter sp. DJ2R-2]|uniref:hypothetical protein n=1 Tax=Paucibacter sp. DJ2R-2 TaxID=2893558 RepID=UPI0021E4B5C1|nr:hypothetical protein [Paucibacter sp. DJ2R-2]MCV2419534.1 hypothetical protein [Paucibacter sp. DJ4R-1]MCV2437563.1 hypothetical protein [Paucibacter sp. DJ2R-2]